MEKLAKELIVAVETLKLESRCKDYDCDWEETKENLLKEAISGVGNHFFWRMVSEISDEIKHYTK